MAFVRAFLIFSLFSQFLLAEEACQISASSKFKIDRVELEFYKKRIEEASRRLNLTEDVFISRLEKNKLSLKKFFQYVDNYKIGKKDSFQSFVFNPQKVLKSIRLRNLNNPNFLFSFISLATFHSLAQAGGHLVVDSKLEYIPLLGAQLTALLITEVALNFGSAKNAAYLVAFPETASKIKNFETNELSKNEKQQLKQIRGNFRKLISISKNIGVSAFKGSKRAVSESLKNATKSFPQLFQVASLAGLISFAGLKFYAEGSFNLDRDLEYILVNAGFHAGFISMWSNFRYQIMQGQIFPALGKSEFWSRHPIARSLAIWSTTSINMGLAVFSYSAGSIYVNEVFDIKSINLEDL